MFFLIISAVFLLSCIGPTTSLGTISSRKIGHIKANNIDSSVNISFIPSYQNFHEKFNLKIKIFDKHFKSNLWKNNLKITYNGHDVTDSMLKQSQAYRILSSKNNLENPELATVMIKGLTLDPLKNHLISVEYINIIGEYSKAKLPLPFCDKEFKNQIVTNVSPFKSDMNLLQLINDFSMKYNFNPILIASLIAQESSFAGMAVSSSRALGLTQITPIASIEIEKIKENWPSNIETRNIPRRKLEQLILEKQVNHNNDWRLDSEKSIEGGVLYLQYLENLWKKAPYSEFMFNLNDESIKNKEMLSIILASYNSGQRRVLNAIKEKDKEYMDAMNLKAAKEYVRKIFSYCNYFETINR